MQIAIGDIPVTLLCPRAALVQRSLMIADLHLGKSETLRTLGAPVPAGDADEQLSRLSALITATRAEQLVVLGDCLHAGIGLTDRLVEKVRQWRRRLAIECWLVRGNHDRAIDQVAEAWSLRLAEPGAVFHSLEVVHDPRDASGTRAWIAGHIHPAVRIGGTANALKLPCFQVVQGKGLVLPAFSLFTGGRCVRPKSSDRVIAIAGNRLIEIGSRHKPDVSAPVSLSDAEEPEEARQAET